MPAETLQRELGPKRWNKYLKITAIRNPFDRAVSQFHWKHRGDPVLEADFAQKREAFAAFLDGPRFKTDRDIVFIGDTFVVDEAVRFEHMYDDVQAIADRQGWDLDLGHMAHTKSMAKKRGTIPLSEYFTPENRDKVLALMSWVFERYDYSTDPRDANKQEAAE